VLPYSSRAFQEHSMKCLDLGDLINMTKKTPKKNLANPSHYGFRV